MYILIQNGINSELWDLMAKTLKSANFDDFEPILEEKKPETIMDWMVTIANKLFLLSINGLLVGWMKQDCSFLPIQKFFIMDFASLFAYMSILDDSHDCLDQIIKNVKLCKNKQ